MPLTDPVWLDWSQGLQYHISQYGSPGNYHWQIMVTKNSEQIIGDKGTGIIGYASKELAEADLLKFAAMYKEGNAAAFTPTLALSKAQDSTSGPIIDTPNQTSFDNSPYQSGLGGQSPNLVASSQALGREPLAMQNQQIGSPMLSGVGSSPMLPQTGEKVNPMVTEQVAPTLRLKNAVDASFLSGAVKFYEVPSRQDPDGLKVPVSPVYIVNPNESPVGSRSKDIVTKTVNAAGAASNVLWTPAAGKAIRILGWSIYVESITTTATVSNLTLRDSIGNIIQRLQVGATTDAVVCNNFLPLSGLLLTKGATAIFQISAALTAGEASCTVWGYEE